MHRVTSAQPPTAAVVIPGEGEAVVLRVAAAGGPAEVATLAVVVAGREAAEWAVAAWAAGEDNRAIAEAP